MDHHFRFNLVVTKAGRPTLTARTDKHLLTISKSSQGGCQLSLYNIETHESEFVNLHKYYKDPPAKDMTFNHTLTAALCAAEMILNPGCDVLSTYHKLDHNKKYISNLDEFLDKVYTTIASKDAHVAEP
jgi:hypothetical protein